MRAAQGAEIDDELAVGDAIGPLTVVGVAGKSPGEVAFHWPARRILIVGDSVIGNPAGQCGLLRDKVMDDPPQLRASVRRLLDLDFDTLLVGDGAPILTGAKDAPARAGRHVRLRHCVGRRGTACRAPTQNGARRWVETAPMLTTVTLKEIERVFAILEEFGLSREAVVIPLKPAQPGHVRLLPDDRLEIVFDRDVALDDCLLVVRERIGAIVGSEAGAGLKRESD